jgi:hypothetical protein
MCTEARQQLLCIHRAPPTVRIEPETQTVSQGAVGELRCTATGDPAPTVRWSKLNEELGSNVQASLHAVIFF